MGICATNRETAVGSDSSFSQWGCDGLNRGGCSHSVGVDNHE